MELWTAFLLGLVGSLHCAGMCGPLALSLPVSGPARVSFLATRAAYNLGRIITYSVLGAAFGLLGHSFALAGLQRWVSLLAGGLVLTGLFFSRPEARLPAAKLVAWLKTSLARRFRCSTLKAMLITGMLNGLLPCGLVYAACAGAVAVGGFLTGIGYMVAFGLGTVPMMFTLALAGPRLRLVAHRGFQRLVPAALALMGMLLILRGLALGIPYFSPDLKDGRSPACHGTVASDAASGSNRIAR